LNYTKQKIKFVKQIEKNKYIQSIVVMANLTNIPKNENYKNLANQHSALLAHVKKQHCVFVYSSGAECWL